jgi:hypothetical protein
MKSYRKSDKRSRKLKGKRTGLKIQGFKIRERDLKT